MSTSDSSQKTTSKAPGRRAKFDIQLDRHEAKYVIPRSLVADIREFIRPFCERDPHCSGDPPEYVITTLQLDSPNMALHHAKNLEAINRFKLRVRTYGDPVGNAPVFMEVKRKIRGTIVKSRTMVPFDAWNEALIKNHRLNLTFKSPKEELGFLEFVRLVKEIGAEPKILIRYTRESYFGKNEHYARVTFDRKLLYLPARSWDGWGRGEKWHPMDSTIAQNKDQPFSGIVLELKTLSDAPQWMIDLVMHFGLVRTGNCKYSTAIWQESVFRGTPELPGYAADIVTNW